MTQNIYIGQAQINMDTQTDAGYGVGDLVVWRSAQLRDKTTRYLVEGFDGDRVILRNLDKHTWRPVAEWFVRSDADVSQSADQGTAEVPRNENTTNAAVQADEQPMSTDSASNHYDRSVVTGTDSPSPTYATCVPMATGSSRSDRLRAVAQQAHDNGDCVCSLPDPDTITITISREDWYWMLELASLRIDNDPLSTLEDEERMDRIAALEGER